MNQDKQIRRQFEKCTSQQIENNWLHFKGVLLVATMNEKTENRENFIELVKLLTFYNE